MSQGRTLIAIAAAVLAVLLFAVVSLDSSDESDAESVSFGTSIPFIPEQSVMPDQAVSGDTGAREQFGILIIPPEFEQFLDVPEVPELPSDVDVGDDDVEIIIPETPSIQVPPVPMLMPHLNYQSMLNMAVLDKVLSDFITVKDEDEDSDVDDPSDPVSFEEIDSDELQDVPEDLTVLPEPVASGIITPIIRSNEAGAAVGPIFC